MRVSTAVVAAWCVSVASALLPGGAPAASLSAARGAPRAAAAEGLSDDPQRAAKASFQKPEVDEGIPDACIVAVGDDGEIDEAMMEKCQDLARDGFVDKSAGVLDENSY